MSHNLSPHRYHLELLATEIQGHLPVVLEMPGGGMNVIEIFPGGKNITWAEWLPVMLRNRGDRPLWQNRPILLIHDATRQPRDGWPQAIIVTLGEEVEG